MKSSAALVVGFRLASFTCRSRNRQIVRTARISSGGRYEFLNSPYVCSFINHWHSCTSLFRPGKFLVSLALTSHTSNPDFCNTSYTATQYTPVDCITTVFTPQRINHSAIRFRSAVQHPNSCTGCASRPGGTAA